MASSSLYTDTVLPRSNIYGSTHRIPCVSITHSNQSHSKAKSPNNFKIFTVQVQDFSSSHGSTNIGYCSFEVLPNNISMSLQYCSDYFSWNFLSFFTCLRLAINACLDDIISIKRKQRTRKMFTHISCHSHASPKNNRTKENTAIVQQSTVATQSYV